MSTQDLNLNPVKEKIAAGDVAYGISVRLSRSGDIARIARATGHDFLYIDKQHAQFNLETIGHMTQVALACGVAPIVRVRGAHDPEIPVLLDAGVVGIVVPDVDSPEQARQVVERARFAPVGNRSYGGASPHFDFSTVSVAESVSRFEDLTLVVCMIESREGLANVEKIAAIDGVDGLYLGMADMLVNMGKPGQFDDPEITDALQRIIDAARANGKFTGCGGIKDVAHQVSAIRRGVQFLTTQSDIAWVSAGARDALGQIRTALAAGPS